MNHLLATMHNIYQRNLSEYTLVLDKNMAPQQPPKRHNMLNWYDAVAEAGLFPATVDHFFGSSSGQVVHLDISHEQPADVYPPDRCASVPRLARSVASRHRIADLGTRPLHLVLTDRSGPRRIQNWKQLNKSLARWASKQGHTLITPPPDWRGVSGLEQARILAGTDVHIGMHGAGMSLSAFQPPGSLVLEIFPRGFKYCRQSTCLSHDGLLWVQLQQDAIPHVNELSRFKMTKNREMGRAVDVNRFINMLDQAFRIDMWSALGMAKPADCPAKTLDGWAKMWLNRAARVPHAACMHALPASGLTPAYDGLHGMRRRNYSSLKQQGKTKQLQRVTGWPACVSSVVPL